MFGLQVDFKSGVSVLVQTKMQCLTNWTTCMCC